MTGSQLFDWVVEYADLGFHRSGSEVDRRTADWAASWLSQFGFEVRVEAVDFPVWTASGQVRVDGVEIEHLAVPYSFTGRVTTSSIHRLGIDVASGGMPAVLDRPMAEARDAGAGGLVGATRHPLGDLVGVNRHDLAVAGTPTFLVAGRHEDHLRDAAVDVDYAAEIASGSTWNVIATSPGVDANVMLTTPLNGWFTCAGERGTGIAVTLDLARRSIGESIAVVLTGGHELGYLGAHHAVERTRFPAVFHVGASVAVEHDVDGARRLISTRSSMCSETRESMPGVFEALADVGLETVASSARWIGEGTAWSQWGVPLVSSTGAGVDFHTPSDVPERVTSAASLVTVSAAYRRAFDFFRASTRR